MYVLLLNGSPHQAGCTATALDEVADRLETRGIQTRRLWLGRDPVAGCIACRRCATSGRCFVKDQVNELLDTVAELQGLVVGSPVYYAGIAGQLKAFLDRVFYAGGRSFDGIPGAAVVSCRRGGASSAFDQINKYFTISSMPVVSSQYWNQVHGRSPEDMRKDLEGLQTMRALADNMAHLITSLRAGTDAGLTKPEREARIVTDFVRSH